MGVAKLQAVKDTTAFLVQQMSSQDRLGVVSFDDQVSCSASSCQQHVLFCCV